MTEAEYTAHQAELAKELGARLGGTAERCTAFMSPHAVATAFLTIGTQVALRHLSPEQVAAWLQGIAAGLLGETDEDSDEGAGPLPN